jgi:hypothetical protein
MPTFVFRASDIITLRNCHMAEESKQPVPPFHQRFNIEVGIDEAQKRFINRVINKVEQDLGSLVRQSTVGENKKAMYNAANKLGLGYYSGHTFSLYVSYGFYECLKVLEAIYEVFAVEAAGQAEALSNLIQYAISLSETDLGIVWRDGLFWPSGAKLLDEALVNENLKWLADKGYQDVLVPFEKGLRHFLEAIQKPERLGDTVTDVYEAVEALAKRVTGRDRDLSANAELFISKLKLSEYYKKMLKDYIEYANDYRHAAKLGGRKKPLLRNEVEAFIYTSGLYIRLAVQQSA